MSKHVIWILSLLALAFSGDKIGGFILHKITQKSQFRYARLYHSQEAADVLFIGNSRGLTFYQPEVERLTNLNTVNLSYNGMPADLAKVLVMDYLDRHPAPKMMVVDVTLCDRYNEGLKAGFNLFTPQSERLTALIKQSATVHHPIPTNPAVDTLDAFAGKKVYYGGLISQLYRYNSEIFQRVLFHRNKTDKDWLIDRVISPVNDEKELTSYQVRMFPNMVTHLKEMIDYAKNKGVAVKLVINPYFPAFAETIRDSFLIPLKMSVEATTGLPVADFSTVLKDREEIGDLQHANKKGSIRYMQILTAEGYFGSTALGYGKHINSEPTQTDGIDSLFFSPTPSVTQPVKRLKSKTPTTKGNWILVDTFFNY